MFKQRAFAAFSNIGPWDSLCIGYIGIVIVDEDDSVKDSLTRFVVNYVDDSAFVGADQVTVRDDVDNLAQIIDDNEMSRFYCDADNETFFAVISDEDYIDDVFTFVEIEPK